MTQTKGFVVGSSHGGKKWYVRIKDDQEGELNGRKLAVQTVHVGTILRPGMDVVFEIDDAIGSTGGVIFAIDVREAPQAEAPKKVSQRTADDASYLSAMIVRHNQGFYVSFISATSVEEAQERIDDMGAESDERVIEVITMTPSDKDGDEEAIAVLSAMTKIMNIYPESVGQTLERFLLEVFSAGMRHGKK